MGTGNNAQYVKKGGKIAAKKTKMMAGGKAGYAKGGMTKSKKK